MKDNKKTSTSKKTIIAGIIALLLTMGIVAIALIISKPDSPVANLPGPLCPVVKIDPVTVEYEGVVGETALATLQSLCGVDLHPTWDGFVTAIAGHEAGDTHYWAFYINDDYANEGAGTYEAQEGDEIKWVLTDLDDAF
ncbi:DUF4430 domain-containing protein [Candidatus Saccharibacteria bacterium]|nr:DUF4430 domain-containing protein [Candidatus Saccharibacteria bacterium]